MRQLSGALMKVIEDALANLRLRPEQIAGQLSGSQVAPGTPGSPGVIDPDDVSAPNTVRERDGSPSVADVTVIEFAGATVTDQGGGVARVTTSGDPALGGDLSGTASAAVVEALQGSPVDDAAPALGDRLRWDGTAWAPSALRWEPLSDGDPTDPALIFAGGDVVMVEV
jgi:hypothetical protein